MDDLPDFDLPDLLPPLAAPDSGDAPAGPEAPPPLPPPAAPAPLPAHELRTTPARPVSPPPPPLLPDMDVPDSLGYRVTGEGPDLTETEAGGTSPSYSRLEMPSPAPGVPQAGFGPAPRPGPLPLLPEAAEGTPGASKGSWDFQGGNDSLAAQDSLDTGESYTLGAAPDHAARMADAIEGLVKLLSRPPAQPAPPAPRVEAGGSSFDR